MDFLLVSDQRCRSDDCRASVTSNQRTQALVTAALWQTTTVCSSLFKPGTEEPTEAFQSGEERGGTLFNDAKTQRFQGDCFGLMSKSHLVSSSR